MRELARICYSNFQDLQDAEGHWLPIKDWPREAAAAVKSVKVRKVNLVAGDGVQEDVLDVQLWDKGEMVKLLFKHLGLAIERVQVSVDQENLQRLDAGRKHAAKRNRMRKGGTAP